MPAALARKPFGGEDGTKGESLAGFGLMAQGEDVCLALPTHLVDAGHLAFTNRLNRYVSGDLPG